MTVMDWLLDSDPAIRWQVLRDLVRAPAEVVAAERARMTTEGWGARLLSLQGEDGQWTGGACFPASGEQYLLERKLFRRKSTGEVVNPSWLQFSSKQQPDGAWLLEATIPARSTLRLRTVTVGPPLEHAARAACPQLVRTVLCLRHQVGSAIWPQPEQS